MPIQYVRQPIIPTDEEGRIIYLADELDKISLALENLEIDNLSEEAQVEINVQIQNIINEAAENLAYPPGTRGQQLVRNSSEPNDVKFVDRDVWTFIQDFQPNDSESQKGDYWVSLASSETLCKQYSCSAYEDALISSGAMSVYLNNDRDAQNPGVNPVFPAGTPILDQKPGGWFELKWQSDVFESNTDEPALLSNTCATEYSVLNGNGAALTRQINAITSLQMDFNLTMSQVCQPTGAGSQAGMFYASDSGSNGIDVDFLNNTDLRIQFDHWGNDPTTFTFTNFRTSSEKCVVSFSYNSLGEYQLYKNWEPYNDPDASGTDPFPLKWEGNIDPRAYFQGGGRTSHLAFWDYAITPAEVAVLREAYEVQEGLIPPPPTVPTTVLAFYVKVAPSTWLNLLSGGGGGGEANTSSNQGAGEGLALAKSGVDLPFKTLLAGDNISLTSGVDTLEISSTGGGSSNIEGGAPDSVYLTSQIIDGGSP
jgi:hypothetical protein